jgi:hypothetical protein
VAGFLASWGAAQWVDLTFHKEAASVVFVLVLDRVRCVSCQLREKIVKSRKKPLTPSLSPSDGERVAEGRVRGFPRFDHSI